jgi:hypothetical protein
MQPQIGHFCNFIYKFRSNPSERSSENNPSTHSGEEGQEEEPRWWLRARAARPGDCIEGRFDRPEGPTLLGWGVVAQAQRYASEDQAAG